MTYDMKSWLDTVIEAARFAAAKAAGFLKPPKAVLRARISAIAGLRHAPIVLLNPWAAAGLGDNRLEVRA